jgi:hypothetical protein
MKEASMGRLAHVLLVVALLIVAVFGLTATSQASSSLVDRRRETAPVTARHEFVEGQLLVRFRRSVAPQRAEQILTERKLSRLRRVQRLDVEVLRLPPGLTVEQAAETFGRLPEVEFAEPNYILRLAQVIDDPNEDLGSNQWAPYDHAPLPGR